MKSFVVNFSKVIGAPTSIRRRVARAKSLELGKELNRQQCQVCEEWVYVDSETGHKFNGNSTDMPHRCTIKIPLYFQMFGFPMPYSETMKAAMIVEKALKARLRLDSIKTEHRGDFLYIRN